MGKYDFDLDLVHSNSLLLILEQVKSNSTILEFGPANGRLTKYLKNSLDCKVYLAELDEEAGREALQYGENLIVGDIENMEWFDAYRDIRFDYIICADILEHLRNPLEILIHAKMLLKAGGSFLISVPNFAHNAVLINLLNNEMEYREIGLLDNTHIHMFTKNSFEKMLAEADLYPVKKMATYLSSDKTEIPADPNSIRNINKNFWKTRSYGEVYQFVYEAKKNCDIVERTSFELKKIYEAEKIQVYRYDGGGFNEENCLKQSILDYKTDNRIVIPLFPGESILRIDPMEQSGIVKVVSCFGITEEGQKELTISDSNAILKEGNLYFFETDDPQWQIRIPELSVPILRIEIVISYVAMLEADIIRFLVKNRQKYGSESRLKETEEKLYKLQEQLGETEKKMKASQAITNDYLEELKKIKRDNTQLGEKAEEEKEQTNNLKQNIDYLQRHVQMLEETLEKKDRLIQDIYNSRTWRINRKVNRIFGRKTE